MFSTKREIASGTLCRAPVATPLQARSSEQKALSVESETDDGDVVMITEKFKSMTLDPLALRGAGSGSVRGDGKGLKGLPPTIDGSPVYHVRLCFYANTAVSTNITVGGIAAAVGSMCTVVNSKVTPICSAFRLRRVMAWAPSSSTATTYCEVFWNTGSNYQREHVPVRALPAGLTVPSGMSFVPPRDTLAADWQASGNSANNLFTLTIASGGVLIVDVDWQLGNTLLQFPDITIGSGTLKLLYYMALDCGTGGHGLTPLGRVTTF